jgi:uncharacterized protein
MPLTVRLIFGVIFLILGVIGSLLPVLQGWMFFVLAAMMFFPQHPKVDKMLIRLEPRMPRFIAWLRRYGIGMPVAERIRPDDERRR